MNSPGRSARVRRETDATRAAMRVQCPPLRTEHALHWRMAIARPQRWYITLTDDAAGAYPVELPSQGSIVGGLILAAMFAGFAAAWWSAVRELLDSHATRSVFDLGSTIFLGGWVLGWSVGTAILGLATVAVLFLNKSLRVSHEALLGVVSLGPLKMIAVYERAAMFNLRVDASTNRANKFDLKFSYGEGDVPVCSGVRRGEAEHVLARIQRFMPTANAAAPANAATFAMPVAPNFVPPPPTSMTRFEVDCFGSKNSSL